MSANALVAGSTDGVATTAVVLVVVEVDNLSIAHRQGSHASVGSADTGQAWFASSAGVVADTAMRGVGRDVDAEIPAQLL